MAETPLFTLGTPDGSWLETATGLLRTVTDANLQATGLAAWMRQSIVDPAAGEAAGLRPDAAAELARLAVPAGPWGVVDANACWVLDALAKRFPQARYLIFVTTPAAALAQWLAHPGAPAEDVDALVRRWRAGAARLLRHAQRHRTRCLMVDAAEARARPDVLAAMCSQRFDLKFLPPAASPATEPDTLAQALGLSLAAGDASTHALQLELHASCVPLADDTAPSADGIDRVQVARRWRALAEELERLRQQNEALRTEAETAKRAAAEQPPAPDGEDAELLLLQLHQVQEELEHYYLAWRALQEQAPQAAGAEPATSSTRRVERVEIGRDRDTPPHRELDVLLHGVQAPDRMLPAVQARLVEHHGRPGLALFAAPGQPTPLMAWQPSGSEDGLDYLLLVPTDAPAAQRLQRLGCGDWALLLQMVDATLAALQAAEGDTAGRWRVVAERLRAELAALPARLRYDRIDVSAAGDAPEAIDARLAPVSFGARDASELRLRWWPRAPQGGAIELLTSEDGSAPPLAQWPVQADGRWVPHWRLPLGSLARGERERAWRALAPQDRALLLGLLDALPAVAERAKAQLGTIVGNPGELNLAAALPLRAARRALHGSRARRVWRALRGRIPEATP